VSYLNGKNAGRGVHIPSRTEVKSRLRLDADCLRLLQAAMNDEEGLALATTDADIKRVLRMRTACLVNVESCVPGTPVAYSITFDGAQVAS
jgi:hypothetical protein